MFSLCMVSVNTSAFQRMVTQSVTGLESDRRVYLSACSAARDSITIHEVTSWSHQVETRPGGRWHWRGDSPLSPRAAIAKVRHRKSRYCHVMYKLLYSIRVRTAPPHPPVSVRVRSQDRVSVSFSFTVLHVSRGLAIADLNHWRNLANSTEPTAQQPQCRLQRRRMREPCVDVLSVRQQV